MKRIVTLLSLIMIGVNAHAAQRGELKEAGNFLANPYGF